MYTNGHIATSPTIKIDVITNNIGKYAKNKNVRFKFYGFLLDIKNGAKKKSKIVNGGTVDIRTL